MTMSDIAVDFDALETDGLSRLPISIPAGSLAIFEKQIQRIGEIECEKHGLEPDADEPLATALTIGGDYRVTLFNKVKQLHIIHEMTYELMAGLENSGMFARLGIELPSLYQTLKGDLPDDDQFTLPYHQDYKLTRCHKAYRAWIPLRDANPIDGSIEFAVGSHREAFPFETDEGGYRLISDRLIDGRFDTSVVDLPGGSGVIFNPLIAHRSVANRGTRMKFALIVQIEDAATLANPFDPNDRLTRLTAR